MKYDCAKLERVIDGDSVHLRINLGLDVWIDSNCRLFGINAPEPRGSTIADGAAARIALQRLMAEAGPTFSVEMDDRDKYGRPLVVIFLPDGKTVNWCMVELGHAVRYYG